MNCAMDREGSTMNGVSQTLDAIFDSAYALHDEAQRVANVAVVLAVRSGAEFSKAKALCRHGEFERRIAQEARVSLRTAQLYMQLARGYPELLEPKAQPVALLPGLRHALALLSADDEVKAEVQSRLASGETVSVQEIERLKRQHSAREAELQGTLDGKQAIIDLLEAKLSEKPKETVREVEITPPGYADTQRRAERAARLETELDSARAQLAQFQAEITRNTEAAIRQGFQERQAELDSLEQRKDALERMVAARLDRFSRFNSTLDANQEIADECAKLAVAFGGFAATVSAHDIPGLEPRTRAQAERVRHLIDGAARALDLLLSLPDLPQECEIREAL